MCSKKMTAQAYGIEQAYGRMACWVLALEKKVQMHSGQTQKFGATSGFRCLDVAKALAKRRRNSTQV